MVLKISEPPPLKKELKKKICGTTKKAKVCPNVEQHKHTNSLLF